VCSKRMPPRERGRPARTTLARPRPSPPPGSTGNGARTPLRPSRCRTRRQGGRVPHRRETERHRRGVHAGGTPALPGGASSHHSCYLRGRATACRAATPPMRQNRHAWWPFMDCSFFSFVSAWSRKPSVVSRGPDRRPTSPEGSGRGAGSDPRYRPECCGYSR